MLAFRAQHYHRRGRTYTTRRISASQISLLSQLTRDSSDSRDSNTTITQRSYNQSTRNDAKADHRVLKKKLGRRAKAEKMSARRNTTESDEQTPDVFQFLQHDSSNDADDTALPRGGRLSISCVSQVDLDKDSYRRPSLADSGISMGDSAAESFHSERALRRPPSSQEETSGAQQKALSSPHVESRSRWSAHASPVSQQVTNFTGPYDSDGVSCFAGIEDSHFCILTADISQSLPTRSLQPLTPVSEFEQDDASATTGYDLIAAELGNANGLPPLYRRFSRLSQRILLQLQDEIQEMEADLTRLDREDQRLRSRFNGRRLPSSR